MLSSYLTARRNAKRGVVHATLNPKGPGSIRVHLVPPKLKLFSKPVSLLILNGYYILPLGYSWTMLLGEFLEAINEKGEGKFLEDIDIEEVFNTAAIRTKKHFPFVEASAFVSDLKLITSVLVDIAVGNKPKVNIGHMSMLDYAPYMTAPHRMDLCVSSMAGENGGWNCNQKCLFCYAAGQENACVKELNTQDWKKIIDKCKAANIPQLTFTGGEPTMRTDLVELVEYSKWFVTRLNTNGILLSKELCNGLKEASLDSVQVTVYSFDEKIHNTLVGSNSFSKTIEGLKNALAAGLNVSVNTPLCKINADYDKTIEFLSDLGVSFFSCSGLIMTGNALASGELNGLESDELLEVLKKAAKVCHDRECEITFTSPGQIDGESLRELKIVEPMCGACLSNMAITASGDVVPCQSWLKSGDTLGNMLANVSWKKIWNGKTATKLRSMENRLCCPLYSKDGGKE